MISSKKTMISAYFTRQGFVSIEALPETERSNYTFFTEIILASIVQSLIVSRPKMQARGYWIHIDNAKPHNSGLSLRKKEELGFTRLPQPPYSPDLAHCDFFLFGYLKKELQGINFRSGNQVISAVRDVLANIPIEMLSRVFDEWTDSGSIRCLGVNALTIGDLGYQIYFLGHVPLDPDETNGDGLAKTVSSVLNSFGIARMTYCAVTDTIAVMPNTASKLKLKWVPCFAHVFNLMLGDIIECMKPYMQPLLKILGPINMSSKWVKLTSGKRFQRIPTYTRIRWYSMWKLVRNALELKPQVQAFIEQTSKKWQADRLANVSEEPWEVMELLSGLLETFRNVTASLESNEFGTLAHVLEGHRLIEKSITEIEAFVRSERPRLAVHCRALVQKWTETRHNHWIPHMEALLNRRGSAMSDPAGSIFSIQAIASTPIYIILIIAVLLNPSVSLRVLTTQEATTGEATLMKWVDELRQESLDRESMARTNPEDADEPIPESRPLRRPGVLSGPDLFDSAPEAHEVTGFLQTQRRLTLARPERFSLWEWWKNLSGSYPILSKVAMQLLLIPATSASCERPFSKAKKLKSPNRMSLKAKNLEAFMTIAGNMRLLSDPHNLAAITSDPK
jgi:hypothetical protein